MTLVVLAGNPNSGKTTLFNSLTGLNYKVANYPGVTVEKKEATVDLPEIGAVTLVDLPGVYSLSHLAVDEQIATNCITGFNAQARPDLVIHVVDSTNIERNFFLLSQLLDCGVRVVVALTMTDLARKSGIIIHRELLQTKLGVEVVPINARSSQGLSELLALTASSILSKSLPKQFSWLPCKEPFYDIATKLGISISEKDPRYLSLSPLFVGSQFLNENWVSSVEEKYHSEILNAQNQLRQLGSDPLNFETERRYNWINDVLERSTNISSNKAGALQPKLDSLLTHRIWGTLFFLVIMGALFQSIFLLSQYPMELLERFIAGSGSLMSEILPRGQFRSLLIDGVLAGVF